MRFVMPTSLGSRLTALRGRRARPPLVLASAAVVVAVIAATLALVLTPGTAHGANFTVNWQPDGVDITPGDGICSAGLQGCTLRAAVMEANALDGDDTITLPAGTYTLTIAGTGENAAATGDLDIADLANKVTITGAGAASTIIDGGGIDRVFQVLGLSTLELSGVTVTNGNAGGGDGGGIRVGGSLTLTSSRVSNSTASAGGGIYVQPSGGFLQFAGSLTLNLSTVGPNNSATFSGGGIWNGGSATLTDGVVENNLAGFDGGGIFNSGTLTLIHTTLSGNATSSGDGGGIHNDGGATLTLDDSAVVSNTATAGDGGGISNVGALTVSNSSVSNNTSTNGVGGGIDNAGMLTLSNTTVSGNSTTDQGGGIYSSGASAVVAMTGGAVQGNTAAIAGGGIWNDGTVTLTGSTVSGNTTNGHGGGLHNVGGASATLTNATVSNNTAPASGGGIYNSESALSVVDSTFIGNQAGFCGGAIHNIGPTATLALTRTTVSGNTAGDDGGGVSNVVGAMATVTASTISGNTATSTAGGIENGSGASLTLTNSTISGNTTTGAGGGILNDNNAVLTVLNSTISGNIAGGVGGGIAHSGATTTLKNSIVAGNTAANCDGSMLSFDNNLDSDNTCNLIAPGDLPGLDPLLGPLASNGGPTQTQALLAGSPAINAGNDVGAPPTDQRGFPRVGVSDIGAFEFQGLDADGDGFDDIAAGGTDCDDGDATIFPGATEIPYDGIDQDCDGSDLTDVDRDGFEADQAVGGTPDCDDTDATVFPGATEILDDGIDQDCDGEDAISEPEAVLTATFALVGGFNAIVFPGADDTPIADLATAIGSITDAIFRFDETSQSWLVYRPDVVVPGLNTLAMANQRDVLFVRLAAGGVATLMWEDVLAAGPVSVDLPPGFSFVGFTGADGTAVADLLAMLPAGVDAAFLFAAEDQEYDVFRRGEPSFLSTFTSADRLEALFIRNTTTSTAVLSWEQVAAGGP